MMWYVDVDLGSSGQDLWHKRLCGFQYRYKRFREAAGQIFFLRGSECCA